MNKELLEKIKKDKYYDYLKQNSFFIKDLIRNPNSYKIFKKYIKEKYQLRPQDKINTVLEDINLISDILNTIT